VFNPLLKRPASVDHVAVGCRAWRAGVKGFNLQRMDAPGTGTDRAR